MRCLGVLGGSDTILGVLRGSDAILGVWGGGSDAMFRCLEV